MKSQFKNYYVRGSGNKKLGTKTLTLDRPGFIPRNRSCLFGRFLRFQVLECFGGPIAPKISRFAGEGFHAKWAGVGPGIF